MALVEVEERSGDAVGVEVGLWDPIDAVLEFKSGDKDDDEAENAKKVDSLEAFEELEETEILESRVCDNAVTEVE